MKKYLFLEYPKCSTCQKAKKWLVENNIEFESRHIIEENPTKEELKSWIEKSNLEDSKFFNTKGVLYREMNLKDKLPTMSFEEKINLLSQDGKLVKRPLLIGEDFVKVGFDEEQWELLK